MSSAVAESSDESCDGRVGTPSIPSLRTSWLKSMASTTAVPNAAARNPNDRFSLAHAVVLGLDAHEDEPLLELHRAARSRYDGHIPILEVERSALRLAHLCGA